MLSTNLPQQRALWHGSSHADSWSTTSGCACFQSSEVRFIRVTPVRVLSALTSPSTSPATPTSLDILCLKCLTSNHLHWKQALQTDHKQLKHFAKQIKPWNVFQNAALSQRERCSPSAEPREEKTLKRSRKGARERVRCLRLSAHTQLLRGTRNGTAKSLPYLPEELLTVFLKQKWCQLKNRKCWRVVQDFLHKGLLEQHFLSWKMCT